MAEFTQEQLDGMSDEELLALDPATLISEAEQKNDADATQSTESSNQDDHTATGDDDQTAQGAGDEDDKDTQNADKTGDQADKGDDTAANESQDDKADVTETKDDKEPVTETASTEEAIKAFHSKITAPFKANGREMKVESAEEAVQLMQMGANYNKKMAALKPNLQLMKMLENAGLLSEEKLSFLIDVASKKPEAISKLVQDSGIDPLDMTAEKAGEYRPTSYKPSDKSLALDEVLDDLKGSPHYAKTLGFVAETLDEESKLIVADNPKVLRNLHQHIADGVFDQVWAEVERQKTFGTLSGLSDLEAYRQVGESMTKSGKLQLPAGVAPPQSQAAAPAKVVVPPKPKQADDSDRRSKRQAASPTKAAAPSSNKLPTDFNPLAMSDEDILKLDISKFR